MAIPPFSWLFKLIAKFRRYYCRNKTKLSGCFLVVVGNITVGGAGKTPVVIALAKLLCESGFKIAVVTRGYKAKVKIFPYLVTDDSTVEQVADEPWLLYNKLRLPVEIDPNRYIYFEFQNACFVLKGKAINIANLRI